MAVERVDSREAPYKASGCGKGFFASYSGGGGERYVIRLFEFCGHATWHPKL